MFVSTRRDLDPMRDAFTFEQQAINSYELGAGAGGGSGNSDPPPSALAERLDVLETQVLKVSPFPSKKGDPPPTPSHRNHPSRTHSRTFSGR